METNQTETGIDFQTQPVLPPIEHTTAAARPQTCESSATTVPPSCVHNSEATCDAPSKIPPLPVPSLLPAICEALPPNNVAPIQAAAPTKVPAVSDLGEDNNKPTKEKNKQKHGSRAENPHLNVQKKKRCARPQPKKTKRPRLGPSQPNLNQRGNRNARKSQSAKGKQTPVSSDPPMQATLIKESENARLTEKKAGTCAKESTSSKAAAKDAVTSQKKATVPKPSGKISGQQGGSSSKPSAANKKLSAIQRSEKATTKQHVASKAFEEVGTLVQGKDQPTSQEPHGAIANNRKETSNAAVVSGSGGNGLGSRGRDEVVSDQTKKRKVDCTTKNQRESKKEATLEEKYKDLSRKYMNLISGMIQPSSKPTVQDNSDQSGESDENAKNSRIVDRKLYDTIYLCNIAGMLGSMTIEGGPRKYTRHRRLEGFENPYGRITQDGFEFVEDLMMVGEPDESCLSSVTTVFSDLHIRLVTELWERYHDAEGGTILVGQTLSVISDQLKQWYLKIVYGKISIRWSALISERLAEPLYRKLKRMNEKLGEEFATTLQGVLKEISEVYQEAEKDITKASLEMFCNSCEVSICVARSVPEAALSLEKEDAYAIGRHNGVFSHCVARLQAERDAEEERRT